MAKTLIKYTEDLNKAFKIGLPKRALDKMAKCVIREIQNRSKSGQSIAQGRIEKFAPLKDSTKKGKRRRGLSTVSRLRETDSMMNTLRFTSNVRKQTFSITPSGGENKAKAGFAHDGSSNRAPRPFIPVALPTSIMKKCITDIAFKALVTKIRKL